MGQEPYLRRFVLLCTGRFILHTVGWPVTDRSEASEIVMVDWWNMAKLIKTKECAEWEIQRTRD